MRLLVVCERAALVTCLITSLLLDNPASYETGQICSDVASAYRRDQCLYRTESSTSTDFGRIAELL